MSKSEMVTTTVYLPAEWVAEAQERRINISAAAREGLRLEIEKRRAIERGYIKYDEEV